MTANTMLDKTKSRRGYSPVPGIDPGDGKIATLLLSPKLLESCRLHPVKVYELAYLVPECVLRPLSIFEGLERDFGDTECAWLCYCSRPAESLLRKHGMTQKEDDVFLVFINPDQVIFQFYWDDCDPQEPNRPKGWEDRFRQQLI